MAPTALAEAVRAADAAGVSGLVARHLSRADPYSIAGDASGIPRKDLPGFCSALFAFASAQATILAEAPAHDDVTGDVHGEGGSAEEPSSQGKEQASAALVGVATAITALLFDRGSGFEALMGQPLLDLLGATQVLHSLLMVAWEERLQESTSRLCEAWWVRDLPEKETLVVRTLPYLLARAVNLRRPADVRRLYAVRDAFSLLDFADVSIGTTKKLLLQCFITPSFFPASAAGAGGDVGPKFLAHCLLLDPQLLREAVLIMRSQVPAHQDPYLRGYSEALFRAWRRAEEESEVRREIEYAALQGLLEAAVLARTPALAKSLRKVLGSFVTNKAQPGVDELLLRVSEPIIFRALQAANPGVRRNAVLVLSEVFPLRDKARGREANEELLERQQQLLSSLAHDACPSVRAAAAEGLGRVLGQHWAMLQSTVRSEWLQTVAEILALDKSCPAVREAALSGLKHLLQTPACHPVLQTYVPALESALLDRSPRVRLAYLDLLAAISSDTDIPMKKVMRPKALVRALALPDKSTVRHVAKLLTATFLPLGKGPEKTVERLLKLASVSRRSLLAFLEVVSQKGGAPTAGLASLARHLAGLAIAEGSKKVPLKGGASITEPKKATGEKRGRGKGSRSNHAHTEASGCTSVNDRGAGATSPGGEPDASAGAGEGQEDANYQKTFLAMLTAICTGLAQRDLQGPQALAKALPTQVLEQLAATSACPEHKGLVLRIATCTGAAAVPALEEHCEEVLIGSARQGQPGAGDALKLDERDAASARNVLSFLHAQGALPDFAAQLVGALEASIEAASARHAPQRVPPPSDSPVQGLVTPVAEGRKRSTKRGNSHNPDSARRSPRLAEAASTASQSAVPMSGGAQAKAGGKRKKGRGAAQESPGRRQKGMHSGQPASTVLNGDESQAGVQARGQLSGIRAAYYVGMILEDKALSQALVLENEILAFQLFSSLRRALLAQLTHGPCCLGACRAEQGHANSSPKKKKQKGGGASTAHAAGSCSGECSMSGTVLASWYHLALLCGAATGLKNDGEVEGSGGGGVEEGHTGFELVASSVAELLLAVAGSPEGLNAGCASGQHNFWLSYVSALSAAHLKWPLPRGQACLLTPQQVTQSLSTALSALLSSWRTAGTPSHKGAQNSTENDSEAALKLQRAKALAVLSSAGHLVASTMGAGKSDAENVDEVLHGAASAGGLATEAMQMLAKSNALPALTSLPPGIYHGALRAPHFKAYTRKASAALGAALSMEEA